MPAKWGGVERMLFVHDCISTRTRLFRLAVSKSTSFPGSFYQGQEGELVIYHNFPCAWCWVTSFCDASYIFSRAWHLLRAFLSCFHALGNGWMYIEWPYNSLTQTKIDFKGFLSYLYCNLTLENLNPRPYRQLEIIFVSLRVIFYIMIILPSIHQTVAVDTWQLKTKSTVV